MIYGHRRYAVVIGPNAEHAANVVGDIKAIFDAVPELAEAFPGTVFPIRKLDGRVQRAATQHSIGKPTKIEWKTTTICLPTTAEYGAGCAVEARGITAGIRGMVRGKQRPDFVFLDDPQDRESANSAAQTADRERIISGDVLGLAGHDRQIAAFMAVTVIVRGDLADRYLDRDAHPDWHGARSKLVDTWPPSPLWETYDELWREAVRAGDGMAKKATVFYAENQASMDAGADVADHGLFDSSTELSAIQHARNLRLAMGEEAYAAEYDNQPLSVSTMVYELTTGDICNRVSQLARFSVPREALAVVAFADINHSALHWSVVAFLPRARCEVAAYGRTPGRGVLVRANASEAERRAAITTGLTQWAGELAACGLKIDRVGIDGGYEPETVRDWLLRRRVAGWVMTRGFASNRYRPDRGLQVFDNAHLTETKQAGRHIAFNADHWRETMQRAFLCDVGAPGACVLHAAPPSRHRDYAEQLTAERLVEKACGSGGTKFYKWTHQPGAHWDWADSLVGCHVLAATLGVGQGNAEGAVIAQRRRVEKRKARVEIER
jgi:hypothetical protein